MASPTAMLTGLSGLHAHARQIEVIGNNIANVNTTGFKGSRMIFETKTPWTVSEGNEPGDVTGGVDPHQVGFGVRTAGTQRDTSQGAINATGDKRDLAVDGEGYFVVTRGQETYYTRDGSFRPDANNNLRTATGELVMGYGVDGGFNVVDGVLSTISIPLGQISIAQATSSVEMAGNLDADGDLASSGAIISLLGTAESGLGLIGGLTGANRLELGSLLVDVEDPAQPSSGAPLFTTGQFLQLSGARKGGSLIPDASLEIGDDTTVSDLLSFLSEALGLHSVANPDSGMPGVTLDEETGEITITGNAGEINDLSIPSTAVRLLDEEGVLIRQPLTTVKDSSSVGESVRTTFVVFDSLGSEVTASMGLSLVSRSNAGTTWRYFVESPDDTGASSAVASGTLRFDPTGRLIDTDPIAVTVDRAGSGAFTPVSFSINFADAGNGLTALADEQSQIAATDQDGRPTGILQDFSIESDGTILGSFSNTLIRPLGRFVLARFVNPGGLVEQGNNLLGVGANSGPAIETVPGQPGTGLIASGSLESSNVDISKEFTGMILTSTGYSAASRVIRTADELIQQLLAISN